MSRPILRELENFGPDRCDTLSPDEARRYTRDITRANRENFSVASQLLPKELRGDFHAVYAFCRWADDLGDAPGIAEDPDRALSLLGWWRQELADCYAGRPRHPVFVALASTIEQHDLPQQLFADLIDAFVQDQTVKRYENWDQLLDYCTRSANPVGRLVLRLYGERSDTSDELADATCTALQLTNFWQDVRRDVLERDRVYIPAEVAGEYGLEIETMVRMTHLDDAVRCQACGSAALKNTGLRAELSGGPGGGGLGELMPAYRATLHALVKQTWPLFDEGRDLWPRVERRFRGDLKLFTLGGEAVLRKIERRRYDTWTERPRIGKLTKAGLVLRVAAGRLLG
ncbi:MAG: squalene/phytoene synthase family protein [Planctomycetota bacterium]